MELISLLDKQANQEPERESELTNLDLSLQGERNSTPGTERAPRDYLSHPSSVFQKEKLRPTEGKRFVQFMRNLGPRLDFLTLGQSVTFHSTTSPFPLLPQSWLQLSVSVRQLNGVGAAVRPCSRGFCWGLGWEQGWGSCSVPPVPPEPAASLHNPLPIT